MSTAGAGELPLRQALVLGLLHGPAELLPVSSSAHTTLVPWLLGWRYGELDPGTRKAFEVALHAGTALGLLAPPPWRSWGEVDGGGRAGARASTGSLGGLRSLVARGATLACAIGPPALAGYTLGERIERHLGTPGTIAAGLLAGAAAMAAGELRASGRSDSRQRTVHEVRPRDGMALGVAQALALVPGLSRNGVTLAVARLRGFSAGAADRLSWQVGLPVIAGAASLKGGRLLREGVPARRAAALAAGAGGALLSTRLSARVLTGPRRMRLVPALVGYRAALAGIVLARSKRWLGSERPSGYT